MIYFSRHRFLFFLSCLAAPVPTILTDVTWDSPAAGDIFIPGDTLQVVWTSPKKVDSPSFTICTRVDNNSTRKNDDPDCGTAVWPSVQENGTEYSISMSIPNVTGTSDYYLVMKDERGRMYDTPNFSLAGSAPESHLARLTVTLAVANDAVSDVNTTIPSNISLPTNTAIAYVPSHFSSAAAAIAIPISLVAAILLGALLLLVFRVRPFGQRAKEKAKRLQEARERESRLKMERMSFASATDIERAILALSADRGYCNAMPFAYPPPPVGAPARPGPAVLGINGFGWAHGSGLPPAPPVIDTYTPAPLRRYATGSSAKSLGYRHTPHGFHACQSGFESLREQDRPRRSANAFETDLRDLDRNLAEEPVSLQLSEQNPFAGVKVHTNLCQSQAEVPPPLPPKLLIPGRLDIHAPRPRAPPSHSSLLASQSCLPPTHGMETHTSFNVISNYVQLSPALPQVQDLNPMDQHALASASRASQSSFLLGQTFHNTESQLEREEMDKPLPLRPQYQLGTKLYGSVSKGGLG